MKTPNHPLHMQYRVSLRVRTPGLRCSLRADLPLRLYRQRKLLRSPHKAEPFRLTSPVCTRMQMARTLFRLAFATSPQTPPAAVSTAALFARDVAYSMARLMNRKMSLVAPSITIPKPLVPQSLCPTLQLLHPQLASSHRPQSSRCNHLRWQRCSLHRLHSGVGGPLPRTNGTPSVPKRDHATYPPSRIRCGCICSDVAFCTPA